MKAGLKVNGCAVLFILYLLVHYSGAGETGSRSRLRPSWLLGTARRARRSAEEPTLRPLSESSPRTDKNETETGLSSTEQPGQGNQTTLLTSVSAASGNGSTVPGKTTNPVETTLTSTSSPSPTPTSPAAVPVPGAIVEFVPGNPTSSHIDMTWSRPRPYSTPLRGFLYSIQPCLASPALVCLSLCQLEPVSECQWRLSPENTSLVNVTGLQPSTNYTATVSAFNSVGNGPVVHLTFRTTGIVPGPVQGLHALGVTSSTLTLFWSAPSKRDGQPLNYSISIDNCSTSVTVECPSCHSPEHCTWTVPSGSVETTEVSVGGLDAYTTYTVSVTAVSSAGPGSASVITPTTEQAAPEAVTQMSVENVTLSSVSVQWSSPYQTKGVLRGFWLSLSKCPDQTVVNCTSCSVAQVRPSGACNWTVNVESGLDLYEVTMSGLEPYTPYDVTVAAFNDAGSGQSSTLTPTTLEGVPDAVTGAAVTDKSGNSLTVEWGPPLHWNGHYVGFGLELLPSCPPSVTVQGAGLEVLTKTNCHWFILMRPERTRFKVIINNLPPFTPYNISLTAKTNAGSGVAVILSDRTGEDAPSQVQGMAVRNVTSNSTELGWSRPLSPNGVIQGYHVTFTGNCQGTEGLSCLDCGTASVLADAAPCTWTISVSPDQASYRVLLSALKPFTTYEVDVTAFTTNGNGPTSPVSWQTQESVPGPVQLPSSSSNSTSVSLSWNEPSEPNGVIQHYTVSFPGGCPPGLHPTVQGTQSDSCSWRVAGNVTGSYTTVIAGLTPYSNYTVSLAAATAVGVGSPTLLLVQTTEGASGPVKKLETSDVTSQSFRVSWESPEEIHGVLLGYLVFIGPPCSPDIRVTCRTCQSLQTYNYSNCTLNVTEATLNQYTIDVTGLQPFTTFTVTVAPVNGYGLGQTKNVTTITAESQSGPVTSLQVQADKDSAQVTWTPPTVSNGMVQGYVVTLSQNQSCPPNVEITCDKCNPQDYNETLCLLTVLVGGRKTAMVVSVHGLNPYSNYTVTVSAINSQGQGIPASQSFITSSDIPGQVSELTMVSKTSRSVQLTWRKPAAPNGLVYAYTVTASSQGSCRRHLSILCNVCPPVNKPPVPGGQGCLKNVTVEAADVSSVTVNVTALLPYSNYSFSVRAFNRVGSGAESMLSDIRTEAEVPTDPTHISAAAVSASVIRVQWTPPILFPGPTSYVVKATNTALSHVAQSNVAGYSSTSGNLTGLHPYTEYQVSVLAMTSVGSSNPVIVQQSVRTLEAAPLEVQALTVTPLAGNFTAVMVSWSCPQLMDRNGLIRNFTLRYSDKNQTSLVPSTSVVIQAGSAACQNDYTTVVQVVPERLYSFAVCATTQWNGAFKQQFYTAKPGPPLAMEVKTSVENPALQPGVALNETTFSVTLFWDRLTEGTNGQVVFVALLVCKQQSCSYDNMNMTMAALERFPSWTVARQKDFTPYRATPSNWRLYGDQQARQQPGRRARAADVGIRLEFLVGADSSCLAQASPSSDYCNGPVQSGASFMVRAVSCTRGGCAMSDNIGPFTTREAASNGGTIAGVIIGLLLIAGLAAGGFFVWKRRLLMFRKSDNKASKNVKQPEELELVTQGPSRPFKISQFGALLKKLHEKDDEILQDQFQEIQILSPRHEMAAAQLEPNKDKSRYNNIYPFDVSRVKLQVKDNDETTDFINANYIPGFTSQREYIATQGPLDCTVADFWRMVWEQGSTIIVQLSDLVEDGRKKVDRYWPEELAGPASYGNIKVEMTRTAPHEKYEVRYFKLTVGKEQRTVKQFFVKGWKDFEANLDRDFVIDVVRKIRQEANPDFPIIVHCSAGVGRTGTFIAVDLLMQQVLQQSPDSKLDIFGLVLGLREHRVYMVQSQSQYTFIHDVLERLIERKQRNELSVTDAPDFQDGHAYDNQAFSKDEPHGKNSV